MFSGLTSQVSSWMGKKTDEELKTEEPATGEESPVIVNDETQSDTEVKKETSVASSRLIGSVKNQMSSVSSWLSRKEEPPAPDPVSEEQPPVTPGAKEDDDSSATGGADSEAGGSEGSGTPIEDPTGGQNFGAATTKALAGAKSLGNLLYSAVNKAGKTVSEASAKIKKTVEENSLLGEFNKEQEAFIKEKSNKNGGAPVPPWVGCPNQEALREECLALSTDRRNFVRAPPEGVEFSFDMEREFSVCQAILQEDPNLEKMRFELVPKVINEENFWRNYLYRVNLICQAAEVSNMAENASVGGGLTETTAVGDERGLSETGFVSEEFPASSDDIREVEEGMKKLGIKTDQESQEWEKELEAELQDYEMVGDKSIENADLIDSDIDDDLKNDIGEGMKEYSLTLLTGEEEAKMVHKAIISGDDETLTSLLATLSPVRRTRLLSHYRAIYSMKLPRELENTLAGDFLDLCYSIVSEPRTFFVKEINTLLNEFPGPNEGLLTTFLCERTQDELITAKETYHKRFKKSLVSDIEKSLRPDTAKWIKLLVNRNEVDTCCDLKQIAMDAQRLINLGMGTSYGKDDPVIASLIKNRCYTHLRLVFSEIRKLGKHPWERIEPVMSSECKQQLIYLLQAIDQPEQFNARALWIARSEPGKFWRCLLLVRLSRSKEFYKKVELHFHELFHTRIQDELKQDTGGNVLLLLKKLIKF